MSDLPASYAVPQYASKDLQRPSNGKIKLKVPLAHQSPPQTSTSTTATSPSQPRTTYSCSKFPQKNHAQLKRAQSLQGPSLDPPPLLPPPQDTQFRQCPSTTCNSTRSQIYRQ